MRAHPVNKLLQQTRYKSAAGLLQVVRFYVCSCQFLFAWQSNLGRVRNHVRSSLKVQLKLHTQRIFKASKAAGQNIDVAEVMDTWTLQMGFPVINVTEDNGQIVLTQQRFLVDPNANQSDTKFTSKYGCVLAFACTYEIWRSPVEKCITVRRSFSLISEYQLLHF